jgi:hypothetical protein
MTIIGGTTKRYQLFQILVGYLVLSGAAVVVAAIVITNCRLRLVS